MGPFGFGGLGQARGGAPGQRGAHHVAENARGQRAAGDARHGRVGVVADPDREAEARGHAREPGVAVVVGRAGLAADIPALHRGRAARAALHGAHQHAVHQAQLIGVEHAGLRARRAVEKRLALGGGHGQQGVRRAAVPSGRKGLVGARHLQEPQPLRAQREARQGPQALQAQFGGDRDHRVAPGFLGDAHGHRVEALRQRVFQAQAPVGGRAAEIGWAPPFHRDRAVGALLPRGQARTEPGEIHEGLEAAAGLAAHLHGAVELALRVVAPAHHGEHAARVVQQHQRALRGAPVRVQMARHGVVGSLLQRGIEAQAHHHVAARHADHALQLRPDPVHGVFRRMAGRSAHHRHRRGERGLQHALAQQAAPVHGAQHGARSRGRAVGIGEGVEPARRLEQARQQGGFGQAELVGRTAEIGVARGFQPPGAAAEIHARQVQAQQFVLGEAPLQPHGEHHFPRLARQGLIGGEEHVFGELLRQGRAALHHPARAGIAVERARQTVGVHAGMGVEAPVLGRQQGLSQMDGDVGDGQGRGAVRPAHDEVAAIAVHHLDGGRARLLPQARRVRQVARQMRKRSQHGHAAQIGAGRAQESGAGGGPFEPRGECRERQAHIRRA